MLLLLFRDRHGSYQNQAAQLQYGYKETGLQDAQGGEKHRRDEQSPQKGTQQVGGVEDTGGFAEARPEVHLYLLRRRLIVKSAPLAETGLGKSG